MQAHNSHKNYNTVYSHLASSSFLLLSWSNASSSSVASTAFSSAKNLSFSSCPSWACLERRWRDCRSWNSDSRRAYCDEKVALEKWLSLAVSFSPPAPSPWPVRPATWPCRPGHPSARPPTARSAPSGQPQTPATLRSKKCFYDFPCRHLPGTVFPSQCHRRSRAVSRWTP